MDDELLYERWEQLKYCLVKRGEMTPEQTKANGIAPIITQTPIKQIIAKGNKNHKRAKN